MNLGLQHAITHTKWDAPAVRSSKSTLEIPFPAFGMAMTAVAPVVLGPAGPAPAAVPAVQLLPWKKEALLETWSVSWVMF